MAATEESLPKTGLAGMISRNYFPLKMAFLLFLVLLLFIALEVIGGVISERTWRRDSVVQSALTQIEADLHVGAQSHQA